MALETRDKVDVLLEQLVVEHPEELMYLNDIPDVKVLLRIEQPKKNVAVVAPGKCVKSYAGFVLKEILTAAVYGSNFSPPTTKSIEAGVRAVTGAAGCILVVESHKSENFQPAADVLRKEGLKVELVTVTKLADAIHKAGTAATAGLILEAVKIEAMQPFKVMDLTTARDIWIESGDKKCFMCSSKNKPIKDVHRFQKHWMEVHYKH